MMAHPSPVSPPRRVMVLVSSLLLYPFPSPTQIPLHLFKNQSEPTAVSRHYMSLFLPRPVLPYDFPSLDVILKHNNVYGLVPFHIKMSVSAHPTGPKYEYSR